MIQEHAFEPRLNTRGSRGASGAGGYRLGNLLVWVLALYLVWPAFGHESAQPLLWGYSGGYLVLLLVLGAGMAAWLAALLRMAGHGQRALFLVTAMVLAGLEGLFRLDVVARRFAPIHHFREITPYLTFSGTRDPAGPRPSGDGQYRVVMLGGSTVNTGDPALPKALEDVFRAEGRPEVRVYNYGVVSYISRQERLQLDLEVLSVQPDLVIVYDGGNDVYQPFFGDPRPQYPYNWGSFEAGYALATNKAGFRRSASMLLRSSALLRCLFDDAIFKEDILRLGALRTEAGYGKDPWRKALADGWLENWQDMARLAGSRSVKAVFLLQPFLTEKRELSEGEKDIDARYDNAFREHMRFCYDRMRAGLETFSAKASGGVAVRDLSRALDDFAGQAFVDVIHVGDQANRHLARKIYEVVRPIVDRDRPLPAQAQPAAQTVSAPVSDGAAQDAQRGDGAQAAQGQFPPGAQTQDGQPQATSGIQPAGTAVAPRIHQAGTAAAARAQGGEVAPAAQVMQAGAATGSQPQGAARTKPAPKPRRPNALHPSARGASGEAGSASAPQPQASGAGEAP